MKVWHHGQGLRAVLIIDMWHPDLTPDQRWLYIKGFSAKREAYLQQRARFSEEKMFGQWFGDPDIYAGN